jgi:hypothetical protein
MLLVLFSLVLLALSEASFSAQNGRRSMVKKSARCPKKNCPSKLPPRRKQCRKVPSSCSYTKSCSQSNSCDYECSSSCSKSESCTMSVSWEESQVHAEIIRQRVKNPKHRLYCRPVCSTSSSSSTSCKSVSCPTEYTTIELIRPHVVRHHKRHIRVKEEICPLSTEVEIIRKKKPCKPCKKSKCDKKKKPRYEIVCKPRKKRCDTKPPCKERCKKEPSCKKTCEMKPKCKKGKCRHHHH